MYETGRRQSYSPALILSRSDRNQLQLRGCATLGPSKDAILVMGLPYRLK